MALLPKRARARIAITALGILGVAALLWITRGGIGISPDSVVYIDAAESLLSGQGYVEHKASGERLPLIHFPPGYPLLLALPKSLGFSILAGARWLNALLFGLNIALVGILAVRSTGGAVIPGILGSVLMLTSSNMLSNHAWAMSEPAFLFFGMLGMGLLAVYVGRPTPLCLAGAVAAVGLAFTTRYLGVAFVATGFVGLVALPSRRDLRRRVADAVLFGALSSFPMALFVVRNRLVRGGVADFPLGFHGLTGKQLWDGVNTVSSWLVPEAVPVFPRVALLALVMSLAIAAALAVTRRRRRGGTGDRSGSAIPMLLAIFVAVYCLGLLGFIVFASSGILFDSRYLLPVQEAAFILVLWLGHEWLSLPDTSRLNRVAAVLVCVAVTAGYTARSTRYAVRARDGLGYANAGLAAASIFRTVRALPPQVTVFSNKPSAVHYFTGRAVLAVPAKSNPHTGSTNPRFEQEMTSLKQLLEDDRAVVVYLRSFGGAFVVSEDELKHRLPVRLLETSEEGSIYEGSTAK